MLSSLCPVMAAILSVSHFRFFPPPVRRPGRGGGDSVLASVPVAGSIGTWIVARLFRAVAAVAVTAPYADCVSRQVTGAAGSAVAGRRRQWQAPARPVECSVER